MADRDPDELAETYQRVRQKMQSRVGEQGPRVHVAMKTPQGIRVANLWESEAQADAAGEKLREVLREENIDASQVKFEQYDLINAMVDGKQVDV